MKDDKPDKPEKPDKAMQVKDHRVKCLAECMKSIEKLNNQKEKQWVIDSLVELLGFNAPAPLNPPAKLGL